MVFLVSLLWSAAPAPGTGCPSLVEAVVAGQGGLSSLLSRCAQGDLIRAVERAQTPPDLTPFVRGRRHGRGEVISWKVRHRFDWEGTCLGHVGEALPAADRLPAPDCLVDAVVREEYDPNELADLNDDRAAFLEQHRDLGALFEQCTGTRTGQACLEEILPRAGRGPGAPLDADEWLKVRGAVLTNAPPAQREMQCRAVLADAQSVVVRCTGSLAQSLCNAETSPLQEIVKPRCASDHSLIVPVRLGPRPSPACQEKARAAARASRADLVETRRRGLEACTAPASPSDDDRDPGSAARGLVTAILRRQHHLLGDLRLPAPCAVAGGPCLPSRQPDLIGRRVADGCGFEVWNIVELQTGGLSDGDWSQSRGRTLARVRQGIGPIRPAAAPGIEALPFRIGNTHRIGNRFSAPITAQKRPATFRKLVGALCARRGRDAELCRTLAEGGQPDGLHEPETRDAWGSARRAVKKDWPSSWRHFSSEQRALDRGLVMDKLRGETRRQTCQPLLIDACTGDVAELCVVTPADDQPLCTGTRLRDGRCQVYRFARLPVTDPAGEQK